MPRCAASNPPILLHIVEYLGNHACRRASASWPACSPCVGWSSNASNMDNRNTPTRARSLARLLGPLLLSVLGTARAQAQAVEGDLVYKFTVEGIIHRSEAKPLQYALMELTTVHACDFIEECACFKLASSVPLDRAALDAMVEERRHRLSGTVEVSDGTLLTSRYPSQR